MNNNESIGIVSASMILITAVGILDHVIIIPILVRQAGRDAWLGVLLAGALMLLWLPLVAYIVKKSDRQHLFDWVKSKAGAWLAWIVIGSIVFQLFMMCAAALRDLTHWTNITYLPKTPNAILVAAFAGVCFYLAHSGIRTIAVVNGLLLPIVIILGFFVTASNFPHKDYTLLFPIMEHGVWPVLKGMFYTWTGLVELLYFVFFQHRIRSAIKFWPVALTGLILIDLALSPLTGAIAIFGPVEASRMRFPAFEQWRMVTFGHFFEHVDFLSVYQWLVGGFIRISFGMCLIAELLKLERGKKRTFWLLLIYFLIVLATQIPVNDMKFVAWLANFYLPFKLIFAFSLSLVLGIVAWLRIGRKERAS